MTLTSNAATYANSLGEMVPGIWCKLDEARAASGLIGMQLPSWASPSFGMGKLPAGAPPSELKFADVRDLHPGQARRIMGRGDKLTDEVVALTSNQCALHYAWRATKMEFRFDTTLALELQATPVPESIPVELLKRLPAPCIYLSIENTTGGFYIWLDQLEKNGQPVLRIFRDPALNQSWPFSIAVIPLVGKSLSDSWQFPREAPAYEGPSDSFVTDVDGFQDISQNAKWIRALGRPTQSTSARQLVLIRKLLSMVLYLCSEQPDLPDDYKPSKSTLKRVGQKARVRPPETVNVWPVGVRLGAIFRSAELTRAADADDSCASGIRRPHMRRAHWHTYWLGPKVKQTPILKWVSPILVGADSVANIPTEVRPALR